MGAGGVATEDLEDEQVDGRDRAEDSLAPSAPQRPAVVLQGERREPSRQVVMDGTQRGELTLGNRVKLTRLGSGNGQLGYES